MMFASKTPRDLNHDPMPYRDAGGWRTSSPNLNIGVKAFDPRPEFDHVQHNPPNPILVGFRTDPEPDADTARFWIAQMDDYSTATDAHIDHARRVLTRLANLTDKEH